MKVVGVEYNENTSAQCFLGLLEHDRPRLEIKTLNCYFSNSIEAKCCVVAGKWAVAAVCGITSLLKYILRRFLPKLVRSHFQALHNQKIKNSIFSQTRSKGFVVIELI